MSTLIYSIAGIIAIVGISLFFSYLENLRDKKWKNRIVSMRKVLVKIPVPFHAGIKKNSVPAVPGIRRAQRFISSNSWNIKKNVPLN